MNRTCQTCTEQLSELIEGTLPERRLSSAKAHLAGCADCRRAHRALIEQRSTLRDLPTFAAPVNLRLRVRAALEKEARKTVRAPAPSIFNLRWQPAKFAWAGSATAMALGLFLVVELNGLEGPKPAAVPDQDLQPKASAAAPQEVAPATTARNAGGPLNAKPVAGTPSTSSVSPPVEARASVRGEVKRTVRALPSPSPATVHVATAPASPKMPLPLAFREAAPRLKVAAPSPHVPAATVKPEGDIQPAATAPDETLIGGGGPATSGARAQGFVVQLPPAPAQQPSFEARLTLDDRQALSAPVPAGASNQQSRDALEAQGVGALADNSSQKSAPNSLNGLAGNPTPAVAQTGVRFRLMVTPKRDVKRAVIRLGLPGGLTFASGESEIVGFRGNAGQNKPISIDVALAQPFSGALSVSLEQVTSEGTLKTLQTQQISP